MPLLLVVPVYLIEAFIVWQVLEIKRKVNQSSAELKAGVHETSEELTTSVANASQELAETVARAMEIGVTLLRQELPKGDDDA